MPHHCVKYQCSPDGVPPPFLCTHPENVRGLFPVMNPAVALANNITYVGLSEGDTTGDAEVIPTQADLQAYLAAVGAHWTQPDPTQPGNPEATIPFDPVAAAQWVWDRKMALDAGA